MISIEIKASSLMRADLELILRKTGVPTRNCTKGSLVECLDDYALRVHATPLGKSRATHAIENAELDAPALENVDNVKQPETSVAVKVEKKQVKAETSSSDDEDTEPPKADKGKKKQVKAETSSSEAEETESDKVDESEKKQVKADLVKPGISDWSVTYICKRRARRE
jgi:hypothetical protein